MHKYWFWRFLFNNHCILSWLSLFFITAYPIQGQTGNISGRVETTTKGALLRGADILLIGTDIGGSTDSSGIYIIANILPGTTYFPGHTALGHSILAIPRQLLQI